MSESKTFETQWGGKTLSIEVGKFANQSNGSCVVRYGDTIVLGTATMSATKREGLDFFPLMVEYEEKLYAAGRIKGSRFVKRAGRPTDEAVLTARFVDRAVRPLFDERLRNEIQIILTVLSFDEENDPDIAALLAASCALHISDIPWTGPIAPIRVGQIEGEWVINPTYVAREKSILDLAFAGTQEKIIMVEAGAREAQEQTVLEAFWFGQKHLQEPMKLIEDVRRSVGKKKNVGLIENPDAETLRIQELSRPYIEKQVEALFFASPQATKVERAAAKQELKEQTKKFLQEQGVEEDRIGAGTSIVGEVLEEMVSQQILKKGRRVDGRGIQDIRSLHAEVAALPRAHGSGHFKRGETQVLSITTLGAPGDEQVLDGMELVGKKRFFHHYNFPPFSVGETKPLRGPSRRDIGHGALAEKAIEPMLPPKESFPYTIHVASEVMGSNGSSSMGATCASTLALMDAGVPLKAAVAGIAMGIATDGKGSWKVFTDLQDLEDGKGGMDFKIAGSATGITAIQMDTKTDGLTKEMVEETITKAKDARMQILEVMAEAIKEPRPELSPYAPRIITLNINPENIGDVIGPGGKVINEIIDTTGVQAIDIEDSGLIMITSRNEAAATQALEWIKSLTREVEIGETYTGKVVRIMDFGAFVEILPKKDGMVHVSELAPWRVERVGDIVKIGQEVKVKVTEIDSMGRVNLSMKQVKENYPNGAADRPASVQASSGNDRPHDRKPRFFGRGPKKH